MNWLFISTEPPPAAGSPVCRVLRRHKKPDLYSAVTSRPGCQAHVRAAVGSSLWEGRKAAGLPQHRRSEIKHDAVGNW